jgi:hyperosmotically inducible protein
MRIVNAVVPGTVLILILCRVPSAGAQNKQELERIHARLASEVRHELVMLSRYTLFDNLQFQITDVDTVVLLGQVTRPSLKSDAESAVRRLEAVGKVVNKIEVLPLSPADDRIRAAAYRAIFSKPGMDKYGFQAVPPIHIIVKNGNITLVGVVANQADKDLAGIAAREVPGTFDVANNLRVEK